MAENAVYQCMENGGGKGDHIDTFVAHCACRVQCRDKVKDLDGYLKNMLNVFSVLSVTRTLKNGTMGAINALLLYNCTKRSRPHFSGSYMSYVSFWGREKNMGTYSYTKWTCSQSLTVLERTISDLQA